MSNTTLTIQCNVGDCWADKTNVFSSTDTVLYVGDTSVAADRDPRAWIPFTVPLARGQNIISADLKVIAAATSSPVTSNIKLSCEAADNPSTPTTGADCNARVRTTATHNHSLVQYTNGVEYTYDVDSAVFEILSRAGWVYGNTLAVMIDDIDTGDKPHSIRSFEHTGGIYRPVLQIVVPSYVPRSSGF